MNFLNRTLCTLMLSAPFIFIACDKDSAASKSPDTARAGDKAITLGITLPTVEGSEVTVGADAEGDLILMPFWATWCKPCIAELNEIDEKLVPRFAGRGLHVYAVSTDGPDSLAKVSGHVARESYSFPVLLDQDTEVLSRYNASGDLPFYVILDSSGEVVYSHQGYVPGDVDKLGDMLEEKLAAKN